MKRSLIILLFSCFFFPLQAQVVSERDKQRARDLVSQMTLEEKIDYIGGYQEFYIRAIPRLGIPEIRMADGPQGVRNETHSTMFPCGIAAVATWNRDLIYNYGRGLGQDAKARGVHIMLGPGVNIYRSPLCGRNFEYFGEDPYLSSETALSYITGMQSEGVMATVKHFVGNNQEWDRHHASSDIDERTLHEIYLPAFRKAVQNGHVGAVMSSYNPVNCRHMTENKELAVDLLSDKWGFDGIYMSDWTSTYSAVGAANGGLDIEMPYAIFMTRENLIPAIKNGVVAMQTIDEKCQHILQTLSAFGFLDKAQKDETISLQNAFSDEVALDVARQSIVLLKNEDNILPLKRVRKVVVMGPNAGSIPTGGGSGFVDPFFTVSVAEGIVAANSRLKIDVIDSEMTKNLISSGSFTTDDGIPGLKCDFFSNKELNGNPIRSQIDTVIDGYWKHSPAEGVPEDNFAIRWSGILHAKESGHINFRICGNDGYRLFIDDKEIISDWKDHGITRGDAVYQVEKGRDYKIRLDFYDSEYKAVINFQYSFVNDTRNEELIKRADAVIYCAGFDSDTEGEFSDREYKLPGNQTMEIKTVARINPNLTVIVNSGGSVDFEAFEDSAKAVLMAWYPGQEGGHAIADILLGKISPSGKLPITIEKRLEDNPSFGNYYENVKRNHRQDTHQKRITYTEGIFCGYRGYDRDGIEPRHPFGYGLSYTDFKYSDMKIKRTSATSCTVSFKVRNCGKFDSYETVQLYVTDNESNVLRPIKELKDFTKVFLKKGQEVEIVFNLDKEAFSYYDINSHDFVVEPGDFIIGIGASSRDIRLKGTLTL